MVLSVVIIIRLRVNSSTPTPKDDLVHKEIESWSFHNNCDSYMQICIHAMIAWSFWEFTPKS